MAALVEGRKLKLTLVSAENLPDVRNFGRMKVYAVVSLNGNTKKTGADIAGETNPTWNFVAGYTVQEAAVQQPEVSILVKLWCQRSLGDRLIGEVNIGVKNLFESDHKKILRYRVAGTPDGELNISCSFGPKMAVSAPRPDAARPRHQSSSSSGKKVLKRMMSLGLSLADELFNGDDRASHVHDQNDHHGYDQEDGDEGDDDEDGGSCNDDQDDDEDEDDDEDGGSCNDDQDDDDEDEDEDEDDEDEDEDEDEDDEDEDEDEDEDD